MTYTLPSSTKNIAVKVHLDRPTKGNPVRQLWLERENGQRELVWRSKADPNWTVLPSKPPGSDEYSDATILAANCSNTRLIVLFQFRLDKNDRLTHMDFHNPTWFNRNEYFAAWDGRIQFLRTFVLDEKGAWRIELSVFPQTVWTSVTGESVGEIRMQDNGMFSLVYAGAWRVVSDFAHRKGYTKEIGAKDGETAFNLVFDENSKLLLTVDETRKKYYVREAQWWIARDEWDVGPSSGQIPERHLEDTQHCRRADEAGLNSVNNERS